MQKEKSVTELKAEVYDLSIKLQQIQAAIARLNGAIEKASRDKNDR